RLLGQLGDELIANRRVGRSARGDVWRRTCQCVQQVRSADNADDLAATQNWQPLYTVSFHKVHDFLERGLLGCSYRTLRHHLRDLPAVRMDIFIRQAPWPNQELQPARPFAL